MSCVAAGDKNLFSEPRWQIQWRREMFPSLRSVSGSSDKDEPGDKGAAKSTGDATPFSPARVLLITLNHAAK